jgi:hypothetical protein
MESISGVFSNNFLCSKTNRRESLKNLHTNLNWNIFTSTGSISFILNIERRMELGMKTLKMKEDIRWVWYMMCYHRVQSEDLFVLRAFWPFQLALVLVRVPRKNPRHLSPEHRMCLKKKLRSVMIYNNPLNLLVFVLPVHPVELFELVQPNSWQKKKEQIE